MAAANQTKNRARMQAIIDESRAAGQRPRHAARLEREFEHRALVDAPIGRIAKVPNRLLGIPLHLGLRHPGCCVWKCAPGSAWVVHGSDAETAGIEFPVLVSPTPRNGLQKPTSFKHAVHGREIVLDWFAELFPEFGLGTMEHEHLHAICVGSR